MTTRKEGPHAMETNRPSADKVDPDFANATVLSSKDFDQMLKELDKPMNPELEAFLAKKSIWDD